MTRSEILWTWDRRGDSESGMESAFYTTSKVKSRNLGPRKRDGMEKRGWFEQVKKKKKGLTKERKRLGTLGGQGLIPLMCS